MFMTINDKQSVILTTQSTNTVHLEVSDAENDKLTFKWVFKEESPSLHIGGDEETEMPDIPVKILSQTSNEAQFIAPKNRGRYRLFVTVLDGHDHFASANIPIGVE